MRFRNYAPLTWAALLQPELTQLGLKVWFRPNSAPNLPYLVCWTFDPAFVLNRSFYIGFYRDWFLKVLTAAVQKGSAKDCGLYNIKGN